MPKRTDGLQVFVHTCRFSTELRFYRFVRKRVPLVSRLQEIAISLSEVLDSRREANSAWELLGRSEALSEERLFAAAKEAKSGGGANKDRAKDLIDAYK